ncbi:MAG: polyphosphate polymerase domain-containing protein [Flavobacteriales bacterium]
MSIQNQINTFSSISLAEMNEVALMKRTDTKFVIPIAKLAPILESVSDQYRVLEISGNRIMTYKSLYFDSPENQFYNDHHNARPNRTKVRIRNYVESDLFFLEIKQKNNKGETDKSRIRIEDFETHLSANSKTFIKETTAKDHTLIATLWNGFKRITLVNIQNKERITIDFDIYYQSDEKKVLYDKLVVVEVKQRAYNRHTPIVSVLKTFRFYPYSISKYCIGMLSLYKNLKYNRFKQKLFKINNL